MIHSERRCERSPIQRSSLHLLWHSVDRSRLNGARARLESPPSARLRSILSCASMTTAWRCGHGRDRFHLNAVSSSMSHAPYARHSAQRALHHPHGWPSSPSASLWVDGRPEAESQYPYRHGSCSVRHGAPCASCPTASGSQRARRMKGSPSGLATVRLSPNPSSEVRESTWCCESHFLWYRWLRR